MREIPIPKPTAAHQRARGRAEVSVVLRDGRIQLDRLYQAGCAKALLPRSLRPVPEVVLINTAGGVTGGDRLDWRLAAGPGAALVATTQAAERIYRSLGDPAVVYTRLTLGSGTSLDWLPRETILFEAGRLARRLEVEMAADARLTALETLIFGRAAMGETLATGALSDQWRIRRDGRLLHAEALRAEGALSRAFAGPATLAGARALATLVHVGPGAGDRLPEARALLATPGSVLAAASVRGDVLVMRFLAPDLAPLRAILTRFLVAFRDAPLPRVWTL